MTIHTCATEISLKFNKTAIFSQFFSVLTLFLNIYFLCICEHIDDSKSNGLPAVK